MHNGGERFAKSCMQMQIGETLHGLQALASPVIRSCHIGNNTINNWAWLALATNTHMVQFDHTLYGMDEVSAPWLVLGNGGGVEAAYDHRGRAQPQYTGLHANRVIPAVERCYLSHLNYGIFAHHADSDLIRFHCKHSAELCRQINGSALGFDSSELLNARELISEVVSAYAAVGKLANIFDRWIRTTRKGHTVMEPLRGIEEVRPGIFRFIGMNGEVLFEGDIEQILAQFFRSMSAISHRLHSGEKLEHPGYPWVRLCFGYLAHALMEYRHNPEQRVFWHAGGSASSYYINMQVLSAEFNDNAEILERVGYLPQQARMWFIPSYSSQLCAVDGDGLEILAGIVDLWSRVCLRHHKEIDKACLWLAETTNPREVVEFIAPILTDSNRRALLAMLAQFNAIGSHKLPIAHIAARPIHPTYNKYGISQRDLYGRRFDFPDSLYSLRWGEAELLTKMLAFYVLDQQG